MVILLNLISVLFDFFVSPTILKYKKINKLYFCFLFFCFCFCYYFQLNYFEKIHNHNSPPFISTKFLSITICFNIHFKKSTFGVTSLRYLEVLLITFYSLITKWVDNNHVIYIYSDKICINITYHTYNVSKSNKKGRS